MKKIILITGATGFIGLELSRHLCQLNYCPHLLVRRPSRAPLLGSLEARVFQGDLESPDSLKRACEGVETVIHLGARAIFEEYDLVKPTIVDGSVNLMQAAIEAGVKHFIYGSSLLVYNSQENPIDGNTPVNPVCGYGEAKLEAEERMTNMAQNSSLGLANIRLPHVYGPGDLMFEQVRNGRVFFPGDGQNVFAHLHVYDAARLLAAVAKQKWVGTLPVADYSDVTWNQYLAEIKKYYPRFNAYSIPQSLAILFTYAIYPFRRMSTKPSVYTPGSVVSWNLNLPVKKGVLWEELNMQPHYSTIHDGIPAVLDDSIPFRWIHPIKDQFG